MIRRSMDCYNVISYSRVEAENTCHFPVDNWSDIYIVRAEPLKPNHSVILHSGIQNQGEQKHF
jgi:hypothetical protein